MLIPPCTNSPYSMKCSGENIDLKIIDQIPTAASANNLAKYLTLVYFLRYKTR